MQIRYAATCDIHVPALAKIVGDHRDNNEILSEALPRKASQSSLFKREEKLASDAGTWRRCTSTRTFAWYGNGFGGQYESGMSVRKSETFSVTSNSRVLKTLDHVLWRVHEGGEE